MAKNALRDARKELASPEQALGEWDCPDTRQGTDPSYELTRKERADDVNGTVRKLLDDLLKQMRERLREEDRTTLLCSFRCPYKEMCPCLNISRGAAGKRVCDANKRARQVFGADLRVWQKPIRMIVTDPEYESLRQRVDAEYTHCPHPPGNMPTRTNPPIE